MSNEYKTKLRKRKHTGQQEGGIQDVSGLGAGAAKKAKTAAAAAQVASKSKKLFIRPASVSTPSESKKTRSKIKSQQQTQTTSPLPTATTVRQVAPGTTQGQQTEVKVVSAENNSEEELTTIRAQVKLATSYVASESKRIQQDVHGLEKAIADALKIVSDKTRALEDLREKPDFDARLIAIVEEAWLLRRKGNDKWLLLPYLTLANVFQALFETQAQAFRSDETRWARLKWPAVLVPLMDKLEIHIHQPIVSVPIKRDASDADAQWEFDDRYEIDVSDGGRLKDNGGVRVSKDLVAYCKREAHEQVVDASDIHSDSDIDSADDEECRDYGDEIRVSTWRMPTIAIRFRPFPRSAPQSTGERREVP